MDSSSLSSPSLANISESSFSSFSDALSSSHCPFSDVCLRGTNFSPVFWHCSPDKMQDTQAVNFILSTRALSCFQQSSREGYEMTWKQNRKITHSHLASALRNLLPFMCLSMWWGCLFKCLKVSRQNSWCLKKDTSSKVSETLEFFFSWLPLKSWFSTGVFLSSTEGSCSRKTLLVPLLQVIKWIFLGGEERFFFTIKYTLTQR